MIDYFAAHDIADAPHPGESLTGWLARTLDVHPVDAAARLAAMQRARAGLCGEMDEPMREVA
jgi:hypothetical protein